MNRLPIKRTRKLQLQIEKMERGNIKSRPAEWQREWDEALDKNKVKVLARMFGLKV